VYIYNHLEDVSLSIFSHLSTFYLFFGAAGVHFLCARVRVFLFDPTTPRMTILFCTVCVREKYFPEQARRTRKKSSSRIVYTTALPT
jgi:hypothetical protein